MRSVKTFKPKRYGKDRKKRVWNVSEAKRLRRTNRWRKLSLLKRDDCPTCENPYGLHDVKPAMATEVHHIKPVELYPELVYDWDNIMSLCRSCHERMEKEGSRKTNGR